MFYLNRPAVPVYAPIDTSLYLAAAESTSKRSYSAYLEFPSKSAKSTRSRWRVLDVSKWRLSLPAHNSNSARNNEQKVHNSALNANFVCLHFRLNFALVTGNLVRRRRLSRKWHKSHKHRSTTIFKRFFPWAFTLTWLRYVRVFAIANPSVVCLSVCNL